MGLLDYFRGSRQSTAAIAKERLQLIIAHERADNSPPHFLPSLQKELVAVISKYVKVSDQDIKVNLEKQGNLEVLEVNIVLPEARG